MPRPAIERPEQTRLNHILLPSKLIDDVDRWAEENMAASRQEALRRLLQMALDVDRVSRMAG